MCAQFCNWKDATVAIQNHKSSGCHEITLPLTTRNVAKGEYVNQILKPTRALFEMNRNCFAWLLNSKSQNK